MSITVASSLATSTFTCGRAIATTSAASASRNRSGGRWRRHSGRGGHDAAEQVEVREAHRVCAPPALGQHVERRRSAGRASSPSSASGQLEAHRRLLAFARFRWRASSRSQSPEVRQHDVLRAGAAQLARQLVALLGGARPRSARGSCGGSCRRAAGARSRGRPATGRRRRAAPARAGRAPRARSRGGGSAAAAAACASRAGRGSRRPRRPGRVRGPGAPARAIASARSVGPAPSGSCPARRVSSSRSRPWRPWSGGTTRASRAPNVITPSRLPWRVARCPTASAAPSATSALRRSAVPKLIEAEMSSSSQVASVRSATCTRTCGSPRARGHGPVDLAHVVAELVGAHLRDLGAVPERGRAVLAGDEAVDPPPHRQVERP